jgi:hypothetical protein
MYAVTNLLHAYDDGLMPFLDSEEDILPPLLIPLLLDGGELPIFMKYVFSVLPHRGILSVKDAIRSGNGCFEKLALCRVVGNPSPNLAKIYEVGQSLKQMYLKETTVNSTSRDLVVTIIVRLGNTGDRGIINTAEILNYCNSYVYNDEATSKFNCQLHEFGSNFTHDLQIANMTDILLGAHGAGLTNMFFLRPSSHVIEVRPYGSPAYLKEHYETNAKILDYVLRFWVINVKETDTLPGHLEANNFGVRKDLYSRDRLMKLQNYTLQVVFDRIIESIIHGKKKYLEMVDLGKNIFKV